MLYNKLFQKSVHYHNQQLLFCIFYYSKTGPEVLVFLSVKFSYTVVASNGTVSLGFFFGSPASSQMTGRLIIMNILP